MTIHQQRQVSVTLEQAAAFRLAHHHLLEPNTKKPLTSVVLGMGGAQSQLPSAAQLAIWTRTRDLKPEHINDAFSQRKLVKATCMRKTLFLVPSNHLATFVRGITQRSEKEVTWARGKGVPQKVLDTAINTTLDVLDQPLTRFEIAERTCKTLGVRMKNVQGGGWGSQRKIAAVPVGKLNYPVVDLLHMVAARGVVCYGPNRDNEPTFVRADTWVPHWQDLPVEEAEDKLLHIYLRAYGPATQADFAFWSGLSLTASRTIWSRNQTHLAPVNMEGQTTYILKRDRDELLRSQFVSPIIRLLPYFDSYILGHRERDHLLPAKFRSQVYRPQGWISPTVLVNGRIAGIWKHIQEKDRLRVDITKFTPMPKHVIDGIRAEAKKLGQFLGNQEVDVQVNQYD